MCSENTVYRDFKFTISTDAYLSLCKHTHSLGFWDMSSALSGILIALDDDDVIKALARRLNRDD